MLVIGGRSNQENEKLALEIYDTESSGDWYKFKYVQRYRHACWAIDNNVYIHGGFLQDSPIIPINEMTKIDFNKLLSHEENLLWKIKDF